MSTAVNTGADESAADFGPDFKKGGGLVPAVVQCAATGRVLMLAYMNEEAWSKTLASGEAHYFSRSRGKLWHKGESSGHVQKVKAVRLDCDRDTVLLLVEQAGGAACHEGYESCFYRELADGGFKTCCSKIFDPGKVYK
ncbi:MAG: phosphoribosyl-AMP cyclohydrolase [Deltaproteobacteria bacterium]|jgi:phosphoribosyl-AMP cyclohydrolase|nr:phosphoribosyl-AMP cyclohydrolase [Deltaproteobacteria bacterium]